MDMRQHVVPMLMTVLGAWGNRIAMVVLVMLIMHMLVLMFQRFVRVFMFVTFGEVQPDAERHQTTGKQQR